MPIDDTYLLFDKEDPNQMRKYQQYKKAKVQRIWSMGMYRIINNYSSYMWTI